MKHLSIALLLLLLPACAGSNQRAPVAVSSFQESDENCRYEPQPTPGWFDWLPRREYVIVPSATGNDSEASPARSPLPLKRSPTQNELKMLARFAKAHVKARAELRAQLKSIRQVWLDFDYDKSGGYLNLVVSNGAPKLPTAKDFPVDGWYADADGKPVMLMLDPSPDRRHVDALEFYKNEGRVLRWPPRAVDVHVGCYEPAIAP